MGLGLFINGKWQQGEGKELISKNPANFVNVWQGNTASTKQIDLAVSSARQSLDNWSDYSFTKRVGLVEKYAKILEKNREKITKAISDEVGKPLWEAKTEVGAMINKVKISIDAYHERTPNKEKIADGLTVATRHKPHGVVAVYGPFNFPGHLPNGHIIPALLAGNAIVFKPSENTPMVAEIIVDLWQQVGLPDGVLNLIHGDKDVGVTLAEHSDLDGVFFTGSFNVGKTLTTTLSRYPHRIIALEMGGNNPLIVHEVNDIKAAVYTTILSAFITSGQRCTCARRLIMPQSEQADNFLNELISTTKQLRVGASDNNPEPFMGPVINNLAASNVEQTLQGLKDKGAKTLLEPKRLEQHLSFITPGIVDITNIDSKVDQECFGPLLQVIMVKDFASAITEANNTSYGLSAGLLSANSSNYEQFYRDIRAGIVNWNKPLTGASSSAPFGGIGKSGNHRPGAYYAADYCAYPVASMEAEELLMPENSYI